MTEIHSPSTGRSKPRTSMRITPSNSPSLRPSSRSPQKQNYQSNISLRAVIGSTVTTPNGLSVHGPSRIFALCAGSNVVLAEVDDAGTISQRFLRARPLATCFYPAPSYYNQFSSPVSPNAARGRSSLSTPKTNSNGNSGNIFNASPTSDAADSAGSRHYSSKDRVKPVKCVSLSPDGRLVAFGEV